MGFIKVNGKWVGKGGDHVGSSSGAHAEDENEDQPHVAATEGMLKWKLEEMVLVLMKLDKVLETWVNASHPCHSLRG